MNSRRLMFLPKAQGSGIVAAWPSIPEGGQCPLWVKSGHVQQTGMSALPPKADMCSAARHVRFGPIADIAERHGEMPRKTSIRQSRFSQALGIPGKILRPAKRNLILQIRNMGRRIELAESC